MVPVDSHARANSTANGSHTVNGHNGGDVTIREENFGTKKRMRIAMLGAGISGINFFKFAEEKLENVDIVCYEKNRDAYVPYLGYSPSTTRGTLSGVRASSGVSAGGAVGGSVSAGGNESTTRRAKRWQLRNTLKDAKDLK